MQVYRLVDLRRVADTVQDSAVREHVSLYFYENPDLYKVIHLVAPRVWRRPEQRFQLDYREDLDFIREVYASVDAPFRQHIRSG